MKIYSSKFLHFINKIPQKIKSILLYGENKGLVKLKVNATVNAIKRDFSVYDAAYVLTNPLVLFGQQELFAKKNSNQILCVRNVDDKLYDVIKKYFAFPRETFLIIYGSDSNSLSKIRKFYEEQDFCAAIRFFEFIPKEKSAFIEQKLKKVGISFDKEVIDFCTYYLPDDIQQLDSEIKKIILFSFETKEITLDNIRALFSLDIKGSLEKVVYSIGDKNITEFIKAFYNAKHDGFDEVAILRAINSHLSKLKYTQYFIAQGLSIRESLAKLLPRIFFKRQNQFVKQINNWDVKSLLKAQKIILNTELLMKTMLSNKTSICCEALRKVI